MTYHVFGAGGMLGKAVIENLTQRGLPFYGYTHGDCPINDRAQVEGVLNDAPSSDIVINCAGSIRGDGPAMVMANALGPQILGAVAIQHSLRMFHVSTDCVFNGRRRDRGNRADDAPDADEIYGRTKIQGELIAVHSPLITVVRTSFIGFDHGLLPWFLSEATAKRPHRIHGWYNAYWSGSTVWAVADRLVEMTLKKSVGGIHHLSSSYPVRKYDLLRAIADQLGLTVNLRRTEKPYVNRWLVPTTVVALPNVLTELEDIQRRYECLNQLPSSFQSAPATPIVTG